MLMKRALPAGIMMAAVLSLGLTTARATDDSYLKMAREYVAKVTAPAPPWTGPTTGPKAQGHKLTSSSSTSRPTSVTAARRAWATGRRKRPR